MSTGEIILILFFYLLFFGAKGIPSLAQTMGKAIYQFRNAAKDVQNEILQSANDIRKTAETDVKLDQIDIFGENEPPAPPKPPVMPTKIDPIPPGPEGHE